MFELLISQIKIAINELWTWLRQTGLCYRAAGTQEQKTHNPPQAFLWSITVSLSPPTVLSWGKKNQKSFNAKVGLTRGSPITNPSIYNETNRWRCSSLPLLHTGCSKEVTTRWHVEIKRICSSHRGSLTDVNHVHLFETAREKKKRLVPKLCCNVVNLLLVLQDLLTVSLKQQRGHTQVVGVKAFELAIEAVDSCQMKSTRGWYWWRR